MDSIVLELADALRTHGVRCSTAEVIDAMQALSLCGLQGREVVKNALGITLAKTQSEKQAFGLVFEQFFGLANPPTPTHPQNQRALSHANPPQNGQGAGDHSLGDPSSNGSAGGSTQQPSGSNGLASLQSSAFLGARRAAQAIGLHQVQIFTQRGRAINQMLAFLRQEANLTQEPSPDDPSPAGQAWQAIRQAVHQLVDGYIALYAQPRMEALRQNSLRHTDFSQLSPKDVERAQTLLQRMAKRLNKPQRQKNTRQKGRLDLRRTLRQNAAYGGPLLHLHWQKRTRPPSQVFAICDVSGSMTSHARFLLLLLHSMHLAIPRLRSFAFSSTLHEIGGLFDQYPAKQAMETALKLVGGGSTNYARAWEGFWARCQGTLNKHSVVLVQGDGRNNYGDAKLAQLKQIARKAKAVFWFNPEPPGVWGSGDSDMLEFSQHCKGVWPCANLKQLETAVHGVIQRMA